MAQIIQEFYNRTEILLLLNTSLNTKGVPIANTCADSVEMTDAMFGGFAG